MNDYRIYRSAMYWLDIATDKNVFDDPFDYFDNLNLIEWNEDTDTYHLTKTEKAVLIMCDEIENHHEDIAELLADALTIERMTPQERMKADYIIATSNQIKAVAFRDCMNNIGLPDLADKGFLSPEDIERVKTQYKHFIDLYGDSFAMSETALHVRQLTK